MREEHMLKEVYLLRDSQNENDIVILMQIQDMVKAKKFVNASDLREVMEKAGVIGEPTISFLTK